MVEKFEAPQVCLPVPADDVRGNVVSLRRMARNTGRCFIMGVMLYMTMSMVHHGGNAEHDYVHGYHGGNAVHDYVHGLYYLAVNSFMT